MNENAIEGGLNVAAGKVEDVIAQIAEAATAAVNRLSEQATAAVSRVSEQARDAYGKASEKAQEVADTVDPFVKDQPYAALGLAAGVGLVLGLLAAGRGPRVIYVRSPPRG